MKELVLEEEIERAQRVNMVYPLPDALAKDLLSADMTPLGRTLTAHEIHRFWINQMVINHWKPVSDLVSPIVISGTGRAGTTYLQRLLGSLPGHMYMTVNEGLTLQNHHTTSAETIISMWDEGSPVFKEVNEHQVHDPGECYLLTAASFRSTFFLGPLDMPHYVDWYFAEGHVDEYRFHRKALQFLQKGRKDRWVLKSIDHYLKLPALFREYPDAILIDIHRNQADTEASLFKLLGSLRLQKATSFDQQRFRDNAKLLTQLAPATAMQQRESGEIPDDRVIDVQFDELVTRPEYTVDMIMERVASIK